jgi:hypothetical protein
LREIELPSEELAEELEGRLRDTKFAGFTRDKGSKTIQFSDKMNVLQWSSLKGIIETWAKGRHLGVVESLRLEPLVTEAATETADSKETKQDVKKKLEGLTPQMAEDRLRYLQSKPFSELTDSEYEERLALAQDVNQAFKRKTAK